MTSTVFRDKDTTTPIVATWLNDINNAVYGGLGAAGVTPTTPAGVRANIGLPLDIIGYGNNLTTALAAIGSTATTLIINHSVAVSVDTTIPANVELQILKGCVITVTAGKTLTINGQLRAGLYQIFGATGSVILGKGCVEEAYPEWWGAVADGTTDNQAALTLYAAALMASTSGVITFNFSSGNYYVTTPVTIYLDATFQGIRMQGTAAISNYVQKGTVFSGAAAITSMFIFRATNITTSYFWSFECKNITFLSGGYGTTGPKTAILSQGGGQTSRNFIIENCTFKGFTSAIKSDMTGSGLSGGIGNAVIRKNFFTQNTYSFLGVGSGSVIGFDFSDNEAGSGGGINVSCEGPYLVSNNILESNSVALGNAPAVVISGGLHNGEISRNYFEGITTGDLITVSATAPQSTVFIHDNYISSCSGSSITTTGVFLNMPQDLSWAGVTVRPNLTSGKSIINSSSIVYPASLSVGEVCLDHNCIAKKSTLLPASLTSGAYSNAVGAAQITPMGEAVNVDTINGSGVARSFTLNALTGDWIVFSALVRKRSGTGNLYIEATDGAVTVSIGTSNTNSAINLTGVGEWVYVMKYFQATANSGATIKWNWTSSGGAQYDVTSTYIYKVATPTLTTPIYLVLPAL